MASWYSLFIVLGAGPAADLMAAKRMNETPTPIIVYAKTFLPSPGGVPARGPCGPNAIQYAVR